MKRSPLALVLSAVFALTATVRAAPNVESEYDKFADKTTIKMQLPGVEPKSAGLAARAMAFVEHEGKAQKEPPKTIWLRIMVKGDKTDRPWPAPIRPITIDNLADAIAVRLHLVLDDKPAKGTMLPDPLYSEATGERGIQFGMNEETIRQLVKGKLLSLRISTRDAVYDVDLGRESIDAVRELAKHVKTIK